MLNKEGSVCVHACMRACVRASVIVHTRLYVCVWGGGGGGDVTMINVEVVCEACEVGLKIFFIFFVLRN